MSDIEKATQRIIANIEETGKVSAQALLFACERDFDLFARVIDHGVALFPANTWGRIVDALGFQTILLCKLLNIMSAAQE